MYILPTYDDPNSGDSHSFEIETEASFVTLDAENQVILIKPSSEDTPGEYLVTVILYDNESVNYGGILST